MKNDWPKLPLGDALHKRECDVVVNAAEAYQFAGVYCFGRGVFRGQEKLGNQFAYQRLTRLRSGDFVYPKLMAWEGAFGIVPENCDGCVVSPEFLVFELHRERISPAFLNFYFQIPRVWEEVSGGSTGTNVRRRRLHPDNFLRAKTPMPPLAEQRRVVARIEELAGQIHEARTLRHQAAEETEALFDSFLTARFDSSGWPLKSLPDVAAIARGKFDHRPRNEPRFYGGDFPFIQIGDLSNSDRYVRTHTQTLNFDRFAISRMFPKGTVAIAITGATIGVTRILGFDSCFPDSIVGIQAKPNEATPEFIYLAVEHAKKAALAEATQTTQPNINLGNLQRLKVHVPPLAEQRRIVSELDALQAEVDALKRLQAETAAELDALLPALLDRAFRGEL